MPTPSSLLAYDSSPFPSLFKSTEEPGAREAFTLVENFAREEMVVLVDARPHWEYRDGGGRTPAVFDVVAAYAGDADTVNSATSLTQVTVAHSQARRFVMGIPSGHKLVVYPGDPARASKVVGAAQDSYVRVTIVDYWA